MYIAVVSAEGNAVVWNIEFINISLCNSLFTGDPPALTNAGISADAGQETILKAWTIFFEEPCNDALIIADDKSFNVITIFGVITFIKANNQLRYL